MWYAMSNIQQSYNLSDRLIRAISDWHTVAGDNDDIEALLDEGADVNRQHGTLLPLHTACMVSDSYCLQLLVERGAQVCIALSINSIHTHFKHVKNIIPMLYPT